MVREDANQYFKNKPMSNETEPETKKVSQPDAAEESIHYGKDIIEHLRGKTEEVNLEQYLKKSFGGYTKQSVLSYLAILRKQEQLTATNFYRNFQKLHEEKETLKKGNETISIRLTKVESDYNNLLKSIRDVESEHNDYSLEDIIDLKSNLAALEAKLEHNQQELLMLNNKVEQQNILNEDLTEKLEQSNQELAAQKQLLASERLETKKQRDMALEFYNRLELERDNNEFLKKQIATSDAIQLEKKIEELIEEISILNEVNKKLLNENERKDDYIEKLIKQFKFYSEGNFKITKTIEQLKEQDEKHAAENQMLADHLKHQIRQYSKAVEMTDECSEIMKEKKILIQILDKEYDYIISLIEQYNKGELNNLLGEVDKRQ